MRRLSRAVWVGVLVLAACGTRLPDSAFDQATTAGSVPVETTTMAGNTASDIGVTPSEVRVGLIVSKTSVLGSETFSPPMYGARAYFSALNERGGVHGRTVRVIVCDDGGTGAGNRRCVRKLIDDDRVFAFAGNSIFNYAGASYVNDAGVPDVGGQPIGNEYDQYRHLFSLYGTTSPRDGRIGINGKLYGGTEVYRYFKTDLATRVAGVVSYNQSDSQRFANLTVDSLELEGYEVVREQVDFSVPNFDAAALDMRAHHVDIVFDALDSTGNVRLCRAMEAARLNVKAKVTTVQSWNELVRTDYLDTPTCRDSLYATGNDRNYMDTQYPTVAQFRDDIRRFFPEREGKLSMWELEGWAAAQWLNDAMTSCGADLTRVCIESFLNAPDDYDGHGLLTPRNFVVDPHPGTPRRNCLNVAQWQSGAYDGRGGWVTRTPDMLTTCFDVPSVAYTP